MEIKLFAVLFTGGVIGHLFLRTLRNWMSLALTGKWHSHISMPGRNWLGERGEAETESKPVEIPKELQPIVDKVIQDRLARERSKFSDYEDLRKFKTEYEKQQETKNQEELIKQKKFEEAENTYKTKLNEYGQKLSAKDLEIQDLRITHALTNEVSKQNGYTEEVIALIKGQTVLDQSGNVLIKSKDANGIDTQVPLSDGVKNFLNQRPHLVRSTHKQGAGTGAGGNGTGAGDGAGGQGEDLNSLNAQLMEASRVNNVQKVKELQNKIRLKRPGL